MVEKNINVAENLNASYAKSQELLAVANSRKNALKNVQGEYNIFANDRLSSTAAQHEAKKIQEPMLNYAFNNDRKGAVDYIKGLTCSEEIKKDLIKFYDLLRSEFAYQVVKESYKTGDSETARKYQGGLSDKQVAQAIEEGTQELSKEKNISMEEAFRIVARNAWKAGVSTKIIQDAASELGLDATKILQDLGLTNVDIIQRYDRNREIGETQREASESTANYLDSIPVKQSPEEEAEENKGKRVGKKRQPFV